MKIPEHLLQEAKLGNVVPFIGAGFSKVANLPTWGELIEQLSSDIGFQPEVAQIYGDFLQLAEYLSIKQNGLGKFRSKLDKQFNCSGFDISSSEAHKLLTSFNSNKIYTTNWDNLIEEAFMHEKVSFNKIVTLDDLKSITNSRVSIIKFHGDFTDDKSIVFTESSYFRRLDFESALDIQLRSDLFSSTLLFLGYSLSDYNLRFMWHKLQQILRKNEQKETRPPYAYIAMTSKNPVFEYICEHSWNIGIIHLDPIDPQSSLIQLLKALV